MHGTGDIQFNLDVENSKAVLYQHPVTHGTKCLPLGN